MAKEKIQLKTGEIIEGLGKMFCAPAYAMLTQVRNGTGYSRNPRTADAMIMSLWPSRGIYLAGIEVKASRSDWVRELRDPQKAEDLAQYCDYWYLAVGDESIVQEGELPKTWGLIAPGPRGGMRIVKEAEKLKATPVDHLFLAAIMRNMCERTIAKDLIQSEIDKARESGKEWAKNELERVKRDMAEQTKRIYAFEEASGVKLDTWSVDHNKEIGAAVQAVLKGKDKVAKKKMAALRDRAQKIVEYLDGLPVSEYEM